MSVVVDCSACGGPMPLAAPCPHCGVKPKRSLRGFVVRAALLGMTACSAPIAVLYGIAICDRDAGDCPQESACFERPPGEICSCSGPEICACTDAGVCAPYESPDGG
jgi:hypothetical protein